MLPNVESPIPETIGLGTIFSLAGSSGVLAFLLATALNRSREEKEKWSSRGIAGGFCFGAIVYLAALIAELL